MQLHKIFQETYITYLQRVNDLTGQRAPLKELLGLSQTQLVKTLVDNARSAGKGTENYKKFKNQLPVCVIGGTFKEERPIIKNIEHPSGLLTIDVDNIKGDELERTLEVLQKIPNIILTQKSVSGAGCWAAFWYDHNKYKDPAPLWNFIYDELFTKGILIDKQCKDVFTRKRFICSDEFWINPSPTIFDNRIPEKYFQKPSTNVNRHQRSSNVTTTVTTTGKKWHFGDKTNYDGVPLLGELVRYLWGLVGKDEYFNVIQNLDIDYKQDLPKRLKRWGDHLRRKLEESKEISLEIPMDSRIWFDENISPLIQISDKNSKPTVTLKTKYLSESKEFIKIFEEYLNNNNIFILQAPTGTGKTNFIRSYAKNLGRIVLTHTCSLRANYIPELTLIEYSGEDPTAAVMTYDRFVLNYLNISDKVIFIDESHELFNTGNYRKNPWMLFKALEELSKRNKIILVSATPGYLNDKYTKLLVNTQIRKTILVKVLHFKHDTRENYLYGVIKKVGLNQREKIVVYSDEYARRIMNKLNPYEKEFVELHHSEMPKEYTGDDFIEKPAALCTSLVCNGINFMNEDPVKIFITIDNRTTSEQIIQFVGRFRKSKNITLYLLNFDGYFEPKSEDDLRSKWRIEDYGYIKEPTYEWRREFTELNNSYLQEHGGWEKIKNELPLEFVFESELDKEGNAFARGNSKEAEMFRDLLNGVEKEYTLDEQITYKKVLKYSDDIKNIYQTRDITGDKCLNIFEDENLEDIPVDLFEFCKTHLVSPRLLRDKIIKALKFKGLTHEKFEEVKNWYDQEMKQAKENPKVYAMLNDALQEFIKFYLKYAGKTTDEIYQIILEDLQSTAEERTKAGTKGDKKKKSKAGTKGDKKKKSKGGKKGGKKGKEIEIEGKPYPTKKAAREALGVSKKELEEMIQNEKQKN